VKRLQIFEAPNAKHFQISVVPMPSISKDCCGGFVGFQGLTIDPNGKVDPLLIFVRAPAQKAAATARSSRWAKRLVFTLARISFFRKRKTLCPLLAHDMAGLESRM
jgi:hypothetical protein